MSHMTNENVPFYPITMANSNVTMKHLLGIIWQPLLSFNVPDFPFLFIILCSLQLWDQFRDKQEFQGYPFNHTTLQQKSTGC